MQTLQKFGWGAWVDGDKFIYSNRFIVCESHTKPTGFGEVSDERVSYLSLRELHQSDRLDELSQ
jgi:hypothetical protein